MPHRLFLAIVVSTVSIAGCSVLQPQANDAASIGAQAGGGTDSAIGRRIAALRPADALLLGEQHDAPEHHAIERQVVETLAARQKLAAVAIEMAEEGRSTTQLPATAADTEVRDALHWNERSWPWADYGPAVMAAVRAGVPVVGANLPQARMRNAMADVSLDAQLNDGARKAQEQAVRSGHCNLLPETQIVPMTRIQIARDRAMAQAIVKAREPGKTVLLIAGAGHTTKALGVPQHLPVDLKVTSVRLLAAAPGTPSGTATGAGDYDSTWQTPPLPEKDYCAGVTARTPGRP